MIVNGIINPSINSLLSRVRHTNTLIIADRGFPHFPGVETVDISLVSGIPRVVDVLRAIRLNCHYGKGAMATEFREVNSPETLLCYEECLTDISMTWEAHALLKARVPAAIGIIRTGDATRYGNVLLESS
jgi:D-ribose pyranase